MAPLMAEHAILLMLALARNLPGYLHSQAHHVWSRQDYEIPPMMQLLRKTIAILGVGGVGGHLAQICKSGFGMQVLGMARTSRDHPSIDRYFQRSELHTALAEADVVALCLPLTPATAHIIDAEALEAMKPTAYLINVARGPLVDEEALIQALQRGGIAGAGLDTTTVEPLPEESPLWTLPRVIITPHVAPGTDGLGENLVDFWCENIRRFAEHEPLLGVVDRHTGY
jgi:phosphoglycerate dehydrogenase-like enzyme